jgi:hypothetical protein
LERDGCFKVGTDNDVKEMKEKEEKEVGEYTTFKG